MAGCWSLRTEGEDRAMLSEKRVRLGAEQGLHHVSTTSDRPQPFQSSLSLPRCWNRNPHLYFTDENPQFRG